MNDQESIFLRARELPEAERPAYLDAACADDTALRARVDELLRRSAAADDFFGEQPATLRLNAEDLAGVGEREGSVIGRYKLLQRIGEGGMGVVYMAEQEEPVRRRVALKIIKLGMDTKSVVARFEAERQALALMDHPNIAKVLDAGATESGRPYFVMELVQGVPITEFCDRNRLSLRERLDLFLPVCKAIQSAHQKGVIHRDIKPSNVMVTLHYGDPMPKVIDFGVAKATSLKLTEKTVFTQFGTMIGTPAYMSPEQAEMSSLDVDTRTDVYSLGVLLYELLTGSTPFPAERLRSLGFGQIQKVIAEEEPPKPSTRLSTLEGEAKTSVAQHRGLKLETLGGELRGDLDWIVMKCLEKDRRRRYDTVNGLAMDLARHLGNEPVLARPPSAAYRLQKAFRRNRGVFIAAAAVFVALAFGLAFASWQAVRARRAERLAVKEAERAATAEHLAKEQAAALKAERDAKQSALADAQAISRFLAGVFQSPDPARDGRSITVAEILDRAARKLNTDLAAQPAERVRLQAVLANTYQSLGLYREAVGLREQVRDHYLATLGPTNRTTLRAQAYLSSAYRYVGRTEEALKLREEVLSAYRQLLGPDDPEMPGNLGSLAILYYEVGRRGEALKVREEAVRLYRRILGDEHHETLTALHNLAISYADAGREEDAVKIREQVLALFRKAYGREHAETILAMNNLAASYGRLGRSPEALTLLDEMVTLSRKLKGPKHPDTLLGMNNLAGYLAGAGRTEELVRLREEILQITRQINGPNHPDTLRAVDSLADAYGAAGRPGEAARLAAESVQGLGVTLQNAAVDGATVLRVAALQSWFGRATEYAETRRLILQRAASSTDPVELERSAKAASLRPGADPASLAAVLALARRAVELGAKHEYLPYFQFAQGLAEYRSGNLAEAEAILHRLAPDSSAQSSMPNAASFYRALALGGLGRREDARTVFAAAAKAMRPLPVDASRPLAGGASADNLIVWMAYQEAKAALETGTNVKP